MNNFIITQLFMGILSMSLTASVIGLLLTAIRPLTEKYFSKKWNYYIWLLVLVRLAVPFHFETDFLHMLNFSADIRQTQPAASACSEIMTGISGGPAAPATPIISNTTKVTANNSNHLTTYASPDDKPGSPVFSVTDFLTATAYLWLFGVMASLFVRIWNYCRFQSAIRKKRVRITDYDITYMENTFCTKLNIHNPPAIYESIGISGPLTVGLWNPVIVFPPNIICEHSIGEKGSRHNPTQFHLMLHHELIHVARKDLLYKWAYQILRCIHWFNPLLGWFGRQMSRDCELSCDEAVLVRLTDAGRQLYGNVLLDAAARNVDCKNSAFSTTLLLENKKDLKKRLDSIMNYTKRTRLQILLSICTFMVMLLLWACSSVQITTDSASGQQNNSASNMSEPNMTVSDGNSLLSQIPYPAKAEDILANWGDSFGPSDAGQKIYNDDLLIAGDDYPENWSAWLYENSDTAYGKRIDASAMVLYGSLSVVIAYAEQDVETDLTSAFDIFEGEFKIVHITPDGNVTAVNNSGAETKQTITMKKGRNVIKMVGHGAKVKKLSIITAGLKNSAFEKVYYSVRDEETAQVMEALKAGAPIDKDMAVRNIFFLSDNRNDISEIFHSLLISRAAFTADDFHCFFMCSDRELSGKYLVEAIEDGYQEAPDTESASIVMPYIDKQYKARLFMQLPPETFYAVYKESLPYMDESQIQECLTDYIQKGGTLTDTDFSKISQYVNERAINELRVTLSES